MVNFLNFYFNFHSALAETLSAVGEFDDADAADNVPLTIFSIRKCKSLEKKNKFSNFY